MPSLAPVIKLRPLSFLSPNQIVFNWTHGVCSPSLHTVCPLFTQDVFLISAKTALVSQTLTFFFVVSCFCHNLLLNNEETLPFCGQQKWPVWFLWLCSPSVPIRLPQEVLPEDKHQMQQEGESAMLSSLTAKSHDISYHVGSCQNCNFQQFEYLDALFFFFPPSWSSLIQSSPPGSSEWKSLAWPVMRGPFPWSWRSWSTTLRCTAFTRKEFTENLGPQTKLRSSSWRWTQVRFATCHSGLKHEWEQLCLIFMLLFPYRCGKHEFGRLQHPRYCQCFQAVVEGPAESSDDLWAIWGVCTCYGWVVHIRYQHMDIFKSFSCVSVEIRPHL